jgi:hypothetical protein
MGLFLVLLWCAAVLLGGNSRFGALNSRFGCHGNWPIKDWFAPPFLRSNGGYPGKIEKIPVITGITRNFAPGGGTAWGAGSSRRIGRLPTSRLPALCDRPEPLHIPRTDCGRIVASPYPLAPGLAETAGQ